MLPSEKPATAIITTGASTSMKSPTWSFARTRNSLKKIRTAARTISMRSAFRIAQRVTGKIHKGVGEIWTVHAEFTQTAGCASRALQQLPALRDSAELQFDAIGSLGEDMHTVNAVQPIARHSVFER